MFTKQAYAAVAGVLSDALTRGADFGAVILIAAMLADLFKHENPGFDRQRFFEAVRS